MNYFYLVKCERIDDRYIANVVKISESYNLVNIFEKYPHMVSLNICQTKKMAHDIADTWNKGFKENNTYYFDII